MTGGDLALFESGDGSSIQVQGPDQHWGCVVKVLNSSGSEVSSELFRVSSGSLGGLSKQTEDENIRLALATTQAAAEEVVATGEVPCADCIQVTTSLIPQARPANLVRRSNGRVPIEQLNPSSRAFDIIKRYEGLRLHFYEDGERFCRNQDASHICRTGTKVYKPTIGWGVQIQDEGEFDDFCRQTLRNVGCAAAKVQWLRVLKKEVERSANVITREQAERLINIEVGIFANRFKRDNPNVRLKQNEFDALISLYYNATFYFTGDSPRARAFQRVLNTPGFNLIDLAGTMYKDRETRPGGPLQGLLRRRLDEINMLLLNADGPGISSRPTGIPNNQRVRNLYKEMLEYWDESSRPFWVSNPSYKPFINQVRALP
jgi:GH24 family phage-related lysozyme (muramidase)